jgi:maleate isomerase
MAQPNCQTVAAATTSSANPQLKLGIIVPSSNTAVETILIALLAPLAPSISVHFARVPVTKLTLDPSAAAQFSDPAPFVAAARLLADAGVDVLGWAGTSGGWMGFAADEALARALSEAVTGNVPATTSTMALNRALRQLSAARVALVTPYVDEVHARILEVYRGAGFDVVADSHLGLADNARIARLEEAVLDGQVRDVLEEGGVASEKGEGENGVQAVATFCTNLMSARWVEKWEAAHGVPVVDSVAVLAWDMLRLKGWKGPKIQGWGRVFDL